MGATEIKTWVVTYMEFSVLQIPENKIKQFHKAGISSMEELLAYYPRKYQDRTEVTGLRPGEDSLFLFYMKSLRYVNSRMPLIKATGYEVGTQTPVSVVWFNQSYLYDKYSGFSGSSILVAGKPVYKVQQYNEPAHYEITNPSIFDTEGENALGIYPIYRKVPGMAMDYLKNCIYRAAEILGPPAETVPQQFLSDNGLCSHADMVAGLHWASSQEELEAALKRKRWDDLLYFALRIELNYRGAAIGSPFNLSMIRIATAVRKSLPFELTPDQDKTLGQIHQWIRTGKRVNALIQGDVGCGKTIVAQLLMIAFAENGYQSVIMAPTQILAGQHYDGLKKLVEPFGMKVAFVSGQKLKKAEQKALEEGIASGEYKLIVGTQALLSDTYKFKNLALVIEDEEHKYGVCQRRVLTEKAAQGTHIVTMSATPIPRSLAQTIYGDNIQLYSIHSKPSGRKPVQTGLARSMEDVYRFIYKEVRRHRHQIYVLCPMIEANDSMEGVASAEETFEQYRKVLEPNGVSVGLVTGKTKKTQAAQIIKDFEENRISVLVSTTVIEVGVNVPNASCIVIHNAERFGLAQLHQLRGRVGRGSEEAWCVLVSEDKENPRLIAMCNHTDGFKIAEMDLELRGAGDFLGNQQSGTEKFLSMALQHSEDYQAAQQGAKWIIDEGIDCLLLQKAIADHVEKVAGVMV